MHQIAVLFQMSFLLFSSFLLSSARNVIEINKLQDEGWSIEGGLRIPKDCAMFGLCENVPDFPEELISYKIKELKNKNTTFNGDQIMPRISLRNGIDQEDIDLCNSFSQYIYPKMGQNVNGVWRYILNTDDEPVQQFGAKVCSVGGNAAIGGECSSLVKFVRNTYGSCAQKYLQRKMYALNINTKEIVQEFFSVPIYCTCVANYLSTRTG